MKQSKNDIYTELVIFLAQMVKDYIEGGMLIGRKESNEGSSVCEG